MPATLAVTVPDAVLADLRREAAAAGTTPEAVAGRRLAADPPAEALADADLLARCAARLPDDQQTALSDLLARNAAGTLDPADRPRFDQLLAAYRRGLVAKAQAVREAVARGLMPPVGDGA